VRAGTFGVKPQQICSYYALKDAAGGFRISPVTVGNCSFDDGKISGALSCTLKEHISHPEYFCDAGEISWNLRFEIQKQFSVGYKKSSDRWVPAGVRTAFSGSITLDGHEFSVLPKKSYGYIDIHFLRTFPAPYFHISSSNLTSRISGKALFNSSFTVQGIFEDSLSLALELEDTNIALEALAVCGTDTGGHDLVSRQRRRAMQYGNRILPAAGHAGWAEARVDAARAV